MKQVDMLEVVEGKRAPKRGEVLDCLTIRHLSRDNLQPTEDETNHIYEEVSLRDIKQSLNKENKTNQTQHFAFQDAGTFNNVVKAEESKESPNTMKANSAAFAVIRNTAIEAVQAATRTVTGMVEGETETNEAVAIVVKAAKAVAALAEAQRKDEKAIAVAIAVQAKMEELLKLQEAIVENDAIGASNKRLSRNIHKKQKNNQPCMDKLLEEDIFEVNRQVLDKHIKDIENLNTTNKQQNSISIQKKEVNHADLHQVADIRDADESEVIIFLQPSSIVTEVAPCSPNSFFQRLSTAARRITSSYPREGSLERVVRLQEDRSRRKPKPWSPRWPGPGPSTSEVVTQGVGRGGSMTAGRQHLGKEVNKEVPPEQTEKQETAPENENVCENIEAHKGVSIKRLSPCQQREEELVDNTPSLPGSFCGFLMVVLFLWLVLENSVDPELE